LLIPVAVYLFANYIFFGYARKNPFRYSYLERHYFIYGLEESSRQMYGEKVKIIIIFGFLSFITIPDINATDFTEEKAPTLVRDWIPKALDNYKFDPHTIAFDSSENLYITYTNNHRIQKFDSNGNFITKWGSEGSEDGQFILPLGLDVDSHENVYVVDQGKANIQKFDSNGNFITKWGPEGDKDGRITTLEDIEIDSFDNVFATDRGRHTVLKFTQEK
jgi:DNA-binding beta-propeller fold protein YncE